MAGVHPRQSYNTSCSSVLFKSSKKIQNYELKCEQENLLGNHTPNPNENINEKTPLVSFMKTNETLFPLSIKYLFT